MTDIGKRKADHIALCATGDVGFQAKTTLFEEVEFIHCALPELSLDEVDTGVEVLGKRLRYPFLIAGMTGGTEQAAEINLALAEVAEVRGYAFGLGSQRALLRGMSSASYLVRHVAPTTLVLGNIGAVQARDLTVTELSELVERVQADALCVHLNPAMEIVQHEGDRDFRRLGETLTTLVEQLGVPIIAKETGAGLSFDVAERLRACGVRHVDVSGAGGTSWVAVEAERAAGEGRELGQALRDWGIPTAASVVACAAGANQFDTIFATGGISSGIETAKALALGAHAAGMARPVLQQYLKGGAALVNRYFDAMERQLRGVMLLVGARDIAELRRTKVLLGPRLRAWTDAMQSPERR